MNRLVSTYVYKEVMYFAPFPQSWINSGRYIIDYEVKDRIKYSVFKSKDEQER